MPGQLKVWALRGWIEIWYVLNWIRWEGEITFPLLEKTQALYYKRSTFKVCLWKWKALIVCLFIFGNVIGLNENYIWSYGHITTLVFHVRCVHKILSTYLELCYFCSTFCTEQNKRLAECFLDWVSWDSHLRNISTLSF